MTKLEHKILPCVFCTIGFNCYVAGNNLVNASVKHFTKNKTNKFIGNKKLCLDGKSIK